MIIHAPKKLISAICFSFFCHILNAQTFSIKNVSLQPSDKTASENVCLDNNGDTCALLKIKTDHLEGILFSNPNQYIKVHYDDGIYYVYVPTISRKLDFIHKDYTPVQLDMANYGYRSLKKGKTYLVVLDASRQTELESTIILKVTPTYSTVMFDGKELETNTNGIFEISTSPGNHYYTITAENYNPQTHVITIGKSEAKTSTIKLWPIMHKILINCNVKRARVFVDNVDYGSVGKMLIPQGEHTIRVQAEGYFDSEQKVNINATTGILSYKLEKNTKVTYHVHPTPVTIYADSKNVFKNGRKIQGWHNGETIMLMPGMYNLADDYGYNENIVVSTEPITIFIMQKEHKEKRKKNKY